jgi:hypothetical protein
MIRRSLLLVLAVAKTPALSSANLLTSSRRHNHGNGNSQDDGGEVCHDPFESDCAEGYYCKMNIGECLKEDEEMVGSCTEVFGGCTRMYRQVSFFVAQFAFAKLSSNIPQLLHDVLSTIAMLGMRLRWCNIRQQFLCWCQRCQW